MSRRRGASSVRTAALRARLGAAGAQWARLLQLLRFSSRRISLVVAALSLLEAVAGIVLLYVVKLLIDTVSDQLGAGAGIVDPGPIFTWLGLIAGLTVLAAALQRLADYARTRQGMEVADYVDRAIHDRAIRVDLQFYESPKYYDSLQRARAAGSQRPAQVVNTLTQLLRSGLFLGAILVLLLLLDWRLVVALIASMALVLVVRLHFSRRLFDWRHRRAQMERRASYLDWLLTSDHHAKELRISQLGAELRDRYSQLRRTIRTEHLGIERRRIRADLGATAVGALVFVAATVWLVLRVIDGAAGLGDLVLFLLLFRRAESSGREFVGALSRLYDDQLYLGQLFGFLDVRPSLPVPIRPLPVPTRIRHGIRFEGVGFTYPDNSRPALEGVDFELAAGRITAIVGENGSGKTSLIKLLCRFYDPGAGRVLLDGTDIRAFDPDAYRRLFSVIFQDFARYADTVSENIRFGDITRPPDDPRIARAAELAGADGFLRDLPQGLQTPLTRLFDGGRELSIGQWQRLALARAFFPDTRFVIMDEPTSAVDPRAEAELFEDFRARLEGRGALVISHRLSTVRMADRIYVLDQGRVLEWGSHADLMAQDGRYARLFNRQMRQMLQDDPAPPPETRPPVPPPPAAPASQDAF